MTKAVTWGINRPDEKKLKKTWKIGVERFINDNKYTPSLSFWACQNKIVEFTESTHIIYWPAKIAQKVANSSK